MPEITGDHTDKDNDGGLTKSQTLILTGQLLQPEDPLYNMVLAFRIRGQLDHELFQQAFQALVDRCDALRTVFVGSEQNYKQRVLSRFSYPVEQIDFSVEPDPESQLADWVRSHSQHAFTLHKCLFESALIKLSEGDYVWYFNQHHLLTDAWSVGIIFRRMQEFYALARMNRLHEAPGLPAFQDYVLQETSQTTSRQFAKAQSYWQQQLASPFVPSHFYRRTPDARSGRTRRIPCELGTARCRRLRALAGEEGFQAFTRDLSLMQLFTTVMFAYLYRLTGNRDLSIGTPSHARTTPVLKDTVGLLIEIFPLKISIDEGETFLSLFKKISSTSQELMVHALPGSTDFEHNRAFDVLLNFIPSSFGDFDGLPVQSEWVHAQHGDRNHLLRLQIHDFDRSDDFTLFFDVNEDVFVGEEGEWVCRHFVRLMDALLDDAAQEITTPPLVLQTEAYACPPQSAAEQGAGGVIDETAVDLFQRQAGLSPDDIALVCDSARLTYAELDQRSTQLAHYLQACAVKPGSVVAISMQRSIDVVVAVFGVLKCGATFLPIDPAYPPERIAFMLSDADAALLLTLARHEALYSAFEPRVICLDSEWKRIAAVQQSTVLNSPKVADTAYIIYTSGSTGQPKGVVVGHQGLANYISWSKDYYLDGDRLDFPLFSSLSFDLTITSLMVPLISGGKLVVYPEPDDAAEITIRRVIEDNQIDIIKLTPSHVSLIQAMDFSRSRLGKMIVGGEDFKTDSAQKLRQYFGGRIEIFNEYGPTEATVACTVHRYDAEKDCKASVPIGLPISNAEIYILDQHFNPVPQGVVGEIFIGGVGVAKGYLNRTTLTDERFLTHPCKPNERVYRTGDLACLNEHGQIEYLGRNDHQVKVRGVRIETSEIEAALASHDLVTEAVVDLAEHLSSGDSAQQMAYCRSCGLAANHPNAQLDEEQYCRICRVYQRQKKHALSYFRTLEDLRELIATIKQQKQQGQDCIMLLSGGKDSSYALCKLVDMGLTPLVFTLDNGYISDGAKANIRRLVDHLGLELVVGETPAMNAIFVDSLQRHSNVCNGCFKTIYTLSMNMARERGIKYICTGLSRGQIFESRVAHLFQQGIYDADEIDRNIITARKAYHRTDDVIARSLDVEIFNNDEIFNEISYLDFYRYTDVTLDEMLSYLKTRASWIRPSDTGRSTNCLINEAGIYVHKRERGYHNYALPYSWDVRLGHKQRDAALDELDDEIEPAKVDRILAEIGYEQNDGQAAESREDYLVAYYVAPAEVSSMLLKESLAKVLPPEYIPSQFVWLSELPLTANGKVDRSALPRPGRSRRELSIDYIPPANDIEKALVGLWSQMLGIDKIGVADNFFDLGGDSIINIQIVAAARDQGIAITPQQIFECPTVRSLARVAGTTDGVVADQGNIVGEIPLLPSQRRFFLNRPVDVNRFNQSVLLEYSGRLDARLLEQAMQQLMTQHDALRTRFVNTDNRWRQVVMDVADISPALNEVDLTGLPRDARQEELERRTLQQYETLDIEQGRLLSISNFTTEAGKSGFLLMVLHHLVTDGVSWWILLGDFETLYQQLSDGRDTKLASKTTSVKQWASALEDYVRTTQALNRVDFWTRPVKTPGGIPNQLQKDKTSLNSISSAVTVSVSLGESETQKLIQDVPGVYGVQVPEVLLTALLQAILPWSGAAELRLDIEGHGREDPVGGYDLMRTVAWFTSLYPVSLHLGNSENPGADLKMVKEQLRVIPLRGVEYGLFRYMSGDEAVVESLAALPPAQVLFNYMGQWERTLSSDSRFQFARPIRAYYGAEGQRSHLLEINALVFDGRLHVDWTYSANVHQAALMDQLASQFMHSLRDLIGYCLSTDESSLTPSDFPAADLDQQGLDDLFSEFGESAS